MPITYFVNEENKIKYNTEEDVENIICYVYNVCKTTYDDIRQGHGLGDFVGCSCFFGTSEQALLAEHIISQMLINNRMYGKIEGDLIKHRIISFSRFDCVTPYEAFGLAKYIANAYGEQYITAYGIHLDTNNIHIHLAIDTISWVDGKRFSISYEKKWINSMIWGWEKAREKIFENDGKEWDKKLRYYGEC